MLHLMTIGRMLGLAVLGALCGCSLLLDTSEFRTSEGCASSGIEPIQVAEGSLEPAIVRGQGFTRRVVARAVLLLPGGAPDARSRSAELGADERS
jgi:hypothetical protein